MEDDIHSAPCNIVQPSFDDRNPARYAPRDAGRMLTIINRNQKEDYWLKLKFRVNCQSLAVFTGIRRGRRGSGASIAVKIGNALTFDSAKQ